jgi:hypothetical protein
LRHQTVLLTRFCKRPQKARDKIGNITKRMVAAPFVASENQRSTPL